MLLFFLLDAMPYSYYVDGGLLVSYILAVMLFLFVWVAATENFTLLGGMVCCCFLKLPRLYYSSAEEQVSWVNGSNLVSRSLVRAEDHV